MQTSSHPPSSSSSSSSSPNSSSLVASSSDSSSSFPPCSRCLGLNLLVKAIHQVTAGSVVGVPYIQRRILTRRRPPIHFNNLIIQLPQSNPKPKTLRHRTMPSKYRDSVLHPFTPKRRSERSSVIKIISE